MTRIQTNAFTCDICGATAETREQVNVSADILVQLPDGWGEPFIPPAVAKSRSEIACDACPACALNPDWSKYQARRDSL